MKGSWRAGPARSDTHPHRRRSSRPRNEAPRAFVLFFDRFEPISKTGLNSCEALRPAITATAHIINRGSDERSRHQHRTARQQIAGQLRQPCRQRGWPRAAPPLLPALGDVSASTRPMSSALSRLRSNSEPFEAVGVGYCRSPDPPVSGRKDDY
jgi:hypothetical protein